MEGPKARIRKRKKKLISGREKGRERDVNQEREREKAENE